MNDNITHASPPGLVIINDEPASTLDSRATRQLSGILSTVGLGLRVVITALMVLALLAPLFVMSVLAFFVSPWDFKAPLSLTSPRASRKALNQ